MVAELQADACVLPLEVVTLCRVWPPQGFPELHSRHYLLPSELHIEQRVSGCLQPARSSSTPLLPCPSSVDSRSQLWVYIIYMLIFEHYYYI